MGIHLKERDARLIVFGYSAVVSEIKWLAAPPGPFYVGDTFSTDGATIIAYYKDGTTADVTAYCTFDPAGGEKLSSDGEVPVTATYMDKTGKSYSADTEISVFSVSEISFVSGPESATEGETLDLSSCSLIAKYTDGTTRDISDVTFDPADGTVVGHEESVTIYASWKDPATDNEYQAEYEVQVNTIKSLSFFSPPDKLSYNEGEALDLTGAVLMLTYKDGTTKDVTASCTFDPAVGTALSEGTDTVTATYKTTAGDEYTAELKIEVKNNIITLPDGTEKEIPAGTRISYLKWAKAPNRTSYIAKEELDLTGAVLRAGLSNGEDFTYTFSSNAAVSDKSDFTFTPSNGEEVALSDNEITAYYNDLSASTPITVKFSYFVPGVDEAGNKCWITSKGSTMEVDGKTVSKAMYWYKGSVTFHRDSDLVKMYPYVDEPDNVDKKYTIPYSGDHMYFAVGSVAKRSGGTGNEGMSTRIALIIPVLFLSDDVSESYKEEYVGVNAVNKKWGFATSWVWHPSSASDDLSGDEAAYKVPSSGEKNAETMRAIFLHAYAYNCFLDRG